ncbi:MAG: 16S rRNA (cytosine(1402)-N(4))-methyltransferase RsmH [bacterium]|nr:16S rRNA (cytosine(1402)-N(4))-methyltransferase RsmH [bacterium]
MDFLHYPVMYKEVINVFRDTGNKRFIDCTLGMGGHSYYILKHFVDAEVIAIDVDGESMTIARDNLKEFGQRVVFHQMNYTSLFDRLNLENKEVSGMLIDPGISTFQLKEDQRGFSFNIDAPLDMRKDRSSGITAHDVINSYKEAQLADIFAKYGEAAKPKALAKKIIETRLFTSIDSTSQLKDIIEKFYHWIPKRGKLHPAAKVFQALRIFINNELEGIESFLDKAVDSLNKGARIAFLTFHSTEDRLIKHRFTSYKREGKVKIIKPFPAFPSPEEVAENPPSHSVKLRVAEIL